MSIVTVQIREGPRYRFRILAVGERTESGRNCPTIDFLQDAEAKEPEDLSRLTALLDYLAEHGGVRNEQKFKHLTGSDSIYEMKTAGGLRLFCFYDEGQLIICTNGIIKKCRKTPRTAIESAEKWKKMYADAQTDGNLTHELEHPE